MKILITTFQMCLSKTNKFCNICLSLFIFRRSSDNFYGFPDGSFVRNDIPAVLQNLIEFWKAVSRIIVSNELYLEPVIKFTSFKLEVCTFCFCFT